MAPAFADRLDVAVLPEPGALAILGIGLIAIGIMRSRRR